MTFKTGFLIGVVIGAFLAYGALGFGGPGTDPETAQNTILVFGIMGLISTAYSVWKRESLGGTTFAGVINGVSWSAIIISSILFGFSYP